MATITPSETVAEMESVVVPDVFFEMVNGQVTEKTPLGTYPVEVASILFEFLGPYVRRAGLGRAIVEALFRINAGNQRRPDIAFVSFEKWPKGRRTPKGQPWEVIPDLAIEAISGHDTAWDVLDKIRVYFAAGVRLVWIIYPDLELIHVYESFTRIRVLTRAEELDGGDVVPGFRLPLATLFEEEEAEGAAATTAG